MKLSEFDFTLPERLIAQHPAPKRDHSKMMVVWRQSGNIEHHRFRELPEILGSDHFLVLNNTRVFPARLYASRPGKKEEIEVLLLREVASRDWLALVKPARKAPLGQKLKIGDLSAHVLDVKESGSRIFRFEPGVNLEEAFEKIGIPPTPPYIRRQRNQDHSEDKLRYQTVYARHSGSVAAPTAGLHFTEEVLDRLKARGVKVCELLLHVGYGTFQPVRTEDVEAHEMEPEYYRLDADNALYIKRLKNAGRRLIAVGTTSTRCLEYLARQENPLEGESSGLCNLFIYPGFEFKLLNGLLTNFHLPRSTLFMLVCAFAGRELMLECYREAIANNYRFYSYGDCMLIL
jgi:S-adenosylmethionine:tRNA ribosyltransferase-isomerase